ncbi:LysM domain-containing protein [Colletotrichum limetticola]|uniref:LysM domain-containing protein n=1 Tax=Colletotrichum limetticola TaxID=1209924 RepID=A0ABQ9PA16_9PEZI|nr:LysM domain-containing protein [Colletotrichum limetticola]
MSGNVDKTLSIAGIALAVREDLVGRQSTFIDQKFNLKITFFRGSVFFRLHVQIRNGDNSPFPIYLQATPDYLRSLRTLNCELDHERTPLKMAMYRLGNLSDASRLTFQFHSGRRAQLIVPKDFGSPDILDETDRHRYDSLASLAAAPSFSVYFPNKTITKSQLDKCQDAVEGFSKLAENKQWLQSFKSAVDPQRLYAGKGTVVHHDELNDSQPDCDKSTTSSTTGSCATTNDYEDDPRYLGEPPMYNECSGQKPATTSDDVSNFLENPTVDSAPPEYSVTECPCPPEVSRPKRVSSGEDGPRESSKRHCSLGGASTLAPTEDVRQIDIKSNSDLAVIHWLELQELVKEQGCMIRTLQRRNRKLESRLDSLEGDCNEILAKQENAQEEIASLALHMGELDEECGTLEKGMPDRREEVHDWLDENRDYFEEYFKGRGDEVSTVATDFARLKAMMREFSNG